MGCIFLWSWGNKWGGSVLILAFVHIHNDLDKIGSEGEQKRKKDYSRQRMYDHQLHGYLSMDTTIYYPLTWTRLRRTTIEYMNVVPWSYTVPMIPLYISIPLLRDKL